MWEEGAESELEESWARARNVRMCVVREARFESEGRGRAQRGWYGLGVLDGRASTTSHHRHVVSANTSRLANTQTKARHAQAGAGYAQTGRTCSASTWARQKFDLREWWMMV